MYEQTSNKLWGQYDVFRILLPLTARIVLKNAGKSWGEDAVLLYTEPPTTYSHFRGQVEEPWQEISFLGMNHGIWPNGETFPSELGANLVFATEQLGYTTDAPELLAIIQAFQGL